MAPSMKPDAVFLSCTMPHFCVFLFLPLYERIAPLNPVPSVQLMKKRKHSQRPRSYKFHLFSTLVVLALGLSAHSCTNIPVGRELVAAGVGLEKLVKELGTPDAAYKG